MLRSSTTSTNSPSTRDELAIVVALAKRLFPRADFDAIGRVADGVSTRVYHIPHGEEALYLRVLPEQGASFAAEAYAHSLLRERGARVPEVVYWEHRHPDLERSVMVTTEIPGRPLSRAASDLSESELRDVLFAAGADLANINSVPVDGFGWIRRDAATVTRLEAESPTFRAVALESLEADLAVLGEQVLAAHEIGAIREIFARLNGALDVAQGSLAHGDLDVTHIFVSGGRYTGIIDFGEIRGADSLYDLAHFKLHDGEMLPPGLLPHLATGYADVRPLPPDYAERLRLLTLLIAIRALSHRLRKRPFDVAARHLLSGIRG